MFTKYIFAHERYLNFLHYLKREPRMRMRPSDDTWLNRALNLSDVSLICGRKGIENRLNFRMHQFNCLCLCSFLFGIPIAGEKKIVITSCQENTSFIPEKFVRNIF